MSMVGTFLVRSGILTSVHAFAVDPRRGSFILALLVIYIGAALALFAFRAGTVREGAPFAPVSREGGLVINNLILSALLGVVFVGTLYPLAAEAISGATLRSEERRVGKECVSTVRSRWSPDHSKKKNNNKQ